MRNSNLHNKFYQIYSLIIKDLKLKFRFKSQFFVEYLVPLISLFFPYIIFNTLFNVEGRVFDNYYSKDNFVLFLLLAYIVELLLFLLWNYKEIFHNEKIWLTLKGLMVAPVSKFNMLISSLISGLISKSIPIILIIVLCYILFPISIFPFLLVLFVVFCISLTFAGIGFIIGTFEIVNENISSFLTLGISFISLVSCLFYPIDIFPDEIHFIIFLNPLYYYFDLLRLSWWMGIDFQNALSYITPFHFLFMISFTVITPLFASFFFIKIYNRYGSSGY